MLDDLPDSRRLVGTKQVLRAVSGEKGNDKVRCVFVAQDAEAHIRDRVTQACTKAGVEVMFVDTMADLGNACGISIGAACAAILE